MDENAVAFTDFDGHFELSLAPGTYSLEISFLGLTTLIIPDVKVVAGEVVAFENLRLKPTTNELMTVTVTASAMRNTESALLDVKRKSATVMDGISAQNFKRIGDGNAAAAVTRVPAQMIPAGQRHRGRCPHRRCAWPANRVGSDRGHDARGPLHPD